jgi:hypothetical protein
MRGGQKKQTQRSSPNSTHTIQKKGLHTLKFWVIDKGVVLQKLVIDCGGSQPSELGPPESYRGVR